MHRYLNPHPSTRRIVRRIILAALCLATMNALGAGAAAQPWQPASLSSGPDVVPTVLDLQGAIDLALERSWRMESVQLDLERDQYNLIANRARLRSNASFDLVIPDFDQSIKEIIDPSTGDPKVLSTRAARYSGALSIRQPLPTDGEVSLNGVMYRTSDELFTYTPGRKTYYGRIFLRYEQPILQPNRIRNNIRRAELQLEGTQLSFNDEQIRIVTQVSRDFFELYEKTYLDSLARAECQRLEELYATGQERFADGVMQEADLLQLEVDLAACRDRASSAAGELAREEAAFKQLIGLPLEEPIAVLMDLDFTPVEIRVEDYINLALEQRSDLRRNEMWMESNEMELRERRSESQLSGEISLTLGLEGRDETMSEFYDAILNPDQARGAAIEFHLPIWDWGRNKARVDAQLASIRKLERENEEDIKTIRREVTATAERVLEAQNRLDLLERSLEAAARSFQLNYEGFEQGDISVQDLLLTQGRLSDARANYLNAYLDWRRALIDLDAVTKGSGFGRGGNYNRFFR